MKKRLCTLCALLLSAALVSACTPAAKPTMAPAPASSPAGTYTPGTYTATTKGFGGDVVVSVTVDAEAITALTATGAKETADIGSRAIRELPATIQATNTAQVEAVSGATVTSTAIMSAVEQALSQARGETISLSMSDGTYSATARGFDLLTPLAVTVTISGGKLSSIAVGEHAETAGMLASVVDLLIPRLLEHQSLNVDAITGATASSNAVKAAVLDCCKQAGGTETTLFTQIPASTATESYEVDVAVVGMGGSGTAAALSAVESGVQVLALDKAGKWGGTSAITSGPAAVNAPSQVAAEVSEWADPVTKEKRIKAAGEQLVDSEALYQEWLSYTTVDGQQHAKTDLIRQQIDQSGNTLDWLIDVGFRFDAARGFVGGKWGIFASYAGNKALTEQYFSEAYTHFTNLGGQYLLETEATELTMEGGKVVGLTAHKADGTTVIVKAKAVVLATGGFGGNAALQEQYLGQAFKLYGMAQNDGSGISMATAVGANTYNIDMPPMSHFVAPYQITTAFTAADNDIPYGMVCTGEALAVDGSGARKLNESTLAMSAYTVGSKYYTIWSKEQIDILRAHGFSADASGRYLSQGGVKADTPLANIDAVLDAGIKQGFIYRADSLEALAAQIDGMNASALANSVAAYRKAAQSGTDTLGKDAAFFARVGAPEAESAYYVAVTGAPYVYSTCGGLDVDASMRVLTESGSPIAGLYAVGTDSMGVLFTNQKGYANYGGIAQGFAFTSGKVAGEAAAKQ